MAGYIDFQIEEDKNAKRVKQLLKGPTQEEILLELDAFKKDNISYYIYTILLSLFGVGGSFWGILAFGLNLLFDDSIKRQYIYRAYKLKKAIKICLTLGVVFMIISIIIIIGLILWALLTTH